AAIRRERDEAEMRSGTPGGPDLRGSLNSDWTVIAEDKPQWRATPLHRFVRLYPVSDSTRLSSVLEPMRRHLSSAALAGFELDSAAGQDLTQTLRKLGFSRLCAPGRMQAPPLDWHHDGRAVLEPLIGENPVGSTP
ncbi:MAG: acyl-CoA reductase, partial [Myxococcota bacterium]|nr:acyl-CoA reductase [Myxococcota bacterium]